MTTAEHSGVSAVSAGAGLRFWLLASLAAFLASIVAWIGFLSFGGIWFQISDGMALLQAITTVPVVVGIDAVVRADAPGAARVARWTGVAGLVLAGMGSILLLTSEVSHQFVPAGGGLGAQFVGFGMVGVWLILVGRLATPVLGRGVSRTATMAGVGFLLGALAAPLGPQSPITALGGVLALAGFVSWCLLTRRRLPV